MFIQKYVLMNLNVYAQWRRRVENTTTNIKDSPLSSEFFFFNITIECKSKHSYNGIWIVFHLY